MSRFDEQSRAQISLPPLLPPHCSELQLPCFVFCASRDMHGSVIDRKFLLAENSMPSELLVVQTG